MIKFKDIKEDTLIYCNMYDSDDYYFITNKEEEKFIGWHLLLLEDPNMAGLKEVTIDGGLWDDSYKSDKARLANDKDKRNIITSTFKIPKEGF